MKEAYDAEFAAVIERAEKQIILAKHGQRLVDLLDDTPITPGDASRVYENGAATRQVLNDAEDDLKSWEKNRTEGSTEGSIGDGVTDLGTASRIPQRTGEDSTMSGAIGTSADKTENEEYASASSSLSPHEH